MAKDKYITKRDERLAILRAYLDEHFLSQEATRLNLIQTNAGNPAACVFSLAGDAIWRGAADWFDNYDVNQLRQHFYVSALLKRHHYGMLDTEGLRQRIMQPFISQYELLAPLVSNHHNLIDWYAHNDKLYDMDKVERHKKWDFYAYHSFVALRGEWTRLISRCEQAMVDPPADKAWYGYNTLYYALAKHDKAEMERLLHEMLTPPKLRRRLTEEPPYTEHFFASRIIIFMKIAWLHGFEVKVDSPYVPMEWMPMTPLAKYDHRYAFLTSNLESSLKTPNSPDKDDKVKPTSFWRKLFGDEQLK